MSRRDVSSATDGMHPFVALMRTYCIDYTNSHDQSLYDEIMEPDYVVHISGFDLKRDESYGPAVTDLFGRAPGLGLVVHEFVLNGDRLCMRFSEHAAMPTEGGRRAACWRGIGLYKWNGRRLTENHVEQDYLAMHRQLAGGQPHPLEPPHLDPWLLTEPVAPDAAAEEAVRRWLDRGDLADAAGVEIDDSRPGRAYAPVLDATEVVVNDLFSAGRTVPFHVTMRGPYRGGIDDVPDEHVGTEVTLHVAGIAEVGSDDAIAALQAVTTRMAVRAALTGRVPDLRDHVPTDRPDVDLLDPTFHVGDPHPAYRWMRAHEPIYFDQHNRLWCVTRMDHLRQVERHAEAFVSSRGYRSIWVPTETSMISKDDPAHTEQRKLVADRFTPRAVRRLEADVREVVVAAVRLFENAGRVEVVDALAARIPSILTCRLIGWDDNHWRDVRSWSERLMRIDTMGRNPLHGADGLRAVFEIAALVGRSLPERRACPADDLLSVWATEPRDGCPMTDEEVNSELGLVIPGGAETTRTTLARALILLAERADLWEQMAAAPHAIPVAVEELLRWITPLNNMFRTAAVEVEVDGTRFNPGDRIALVYPSANRDERVFADPDDVDLARDPNPHIAFGFGTHFCLGAHVARLTLRVALEELTARFTNLRAASPPRYEANVFVKAVEQFELAFDRR